VYKVDISQAAAEEIEKIFYADRRIYKRIMAALVSLQTDPLQGKLLSRELKGRRSLRVGDYRIIYAVLHQVLTVQVIDVGHRREIYR
jgi:mRNA interferase RelE/StbE